MIDLHTHSTASDGSMTPTQLVIHAKENGISAMALTDHDTVDGIGEFKTAAQKIGIDAISGVEISAKFRREMHILGLFVDESNSEFKSVLKELRMSRQSRNKTVLELVVQSGMDITEDDIKSQKDGATMENTGRAHIASAMVKKGYAKSIQDAFDTYLSKGKPCYVDRKTLPPKETIELIKSAGGIAILAHPIYITKDKDELCELLIQLKDYGLDGVECFYSEYPKEYQDLCLMLCDKLGLLVSGGSDFHGTTKPHIQIGRVTGGAVIDSYILDKMHKITNLQVDN